MHFVVDKAINPAIPATMPATPTQKSFALSQKN